jgi:hypothetical protein
MVDEAVSVVDNDCDAVIEKRTKHAINCRGGLLPDLEAFTFGVFKPPAS